MRDDLIARHTFLNNGSGFCVHCCLPMGSHVLTCPRALTAQGETARQLRAAWEAGFDLCRSYGDNHAHFDGDQKERRWCEFLAAQGETAPDVAVGGSLPNIPIRQSEVQIGSRQPAPLSMLPTGRSTPYIAPPVEGDREGEIAAQGETASASGDEHATLVQAENSKSDAVFFSVKVAAASPLPAAEGLESKFADLAAAYCAGCSRKQPMACYNMHGTQTGRPGSNLSCDATPIREAWKACGGDYMTDWSLRAVAEGRR